MQTFDNMNKALKLSCTKGLPVRVVRSFKEKRSAYAPTEDTPVRYDGIYRIARCWRTKGKQVGGCGRACVRVSAGACFAMLCVLWGVGMVAGS